MQSGRTWSGLPAGKYVLVVTGGSEPRQLFTRLDKALLFIQGNADWVLYVTDTQTEAEAYSFGAGLSGLPNLTC